MTQKDYELAATLVQAIHEAEGAQVAQSVAVAFATLFRMDGNPRFDLARFRRACVVGANVKARGRKGAVNVVD